MFHFGTNHNHHANGGTASCRSAVFFAARRRRRGEDETGTSRRTGRMGEDFEMKKEDGEDGNGIQRENENQAF